MQLYHVVSSNQGGLFANLIPPCYLLRSQGFPVSELFQILCPFLFPVVVFWGCRGGKALFFSSSLPTFSFHSFSSGIIGWGGKGDFWNFPQKNVGPGKWDLLAKGTVVCWENILKEYALRTNSGWSKYLKNHLSPEQNFAFGLHLRITWPIRTFNSWALLGFWGSHLEHQGYGLEIVLDA